MTAEIAILNKSAVALATDSAVTISSGNSHEKVFDSADKLFELSCEQPIGIMIYNGMQFSGIPLQDLIKEFRAQRMLFDSVDAAANKFLEFLTDTGRSAPKSEKVSLIQSIVYPFFALINDRVRNTVLKAINSNVQEGKETDIQKLEQDSIQKVLLAIERAVNHRGKGTFFGAKKTPTLINIEKEEVINAVTKQFPDYLDSTQLQIVDLSTKLLISSELSATKTGVVIAGLGKKERFPTLVSFEFDGVVAGKLKMEWTEKCDIERGGEKAFVKPFAQKEMVERFLYGLDEDIQRKVLAYCKQTIGSISDQILSQIVLPNVNDSEVLTKKARVAENAFLNNLQTEAFNLGSRLIKLDPQPHGCEFDHGHKIA